MLPYGIIFANYTRNGIIHHIELLLNISSLHCYLEILCHIQYSLLYIVWQVIFIIRREAGFNNNLGFIRNLDFIEIHLDKSSSNVKIQGNLVKQETFIPEINIIP